MLMADVRGIVATAPAAGSVGRLALVSDDRQAARFYVQAAQL